MFPSIAYGMRNRQSNNERFVSLFINQAIKFLLNRVATGLEMVREIWYFELKSWKIEII